MAKYKKKPIIIDAVQWDGTEESFRQVLDMNRTESFCHYIREEGMIAIETLEGIMYAMPNDWIIKGINGEFYPCKPDIFEETYEELSDE